MIRKIAVLSDVHGNKTALDAVLDDLNHNEITDYWFLGDLFMPGPRSQDIYQTLLDFQFSIKIRGNWDDCFLEIVDKDPILSIEDPTDIYIAKLSQYAIASGIDSKIIDEIRLWPHSTTVTINGVNILLSHNSPNCNYGKNLVVFGEQRSFDGIFELNNADIAIYGHIHCPLLRYSTKGQPIINVGSVGTPYYHNPSFLPDLRAQYAILTIDENGLFDVDFRKVSYNREDELLAAKKLNHPYLELYEELILTGNAQTHNKPLLEAFNTKNNYKQDVEHIFLKKEI